MMKLMKKVKWKQPTIHWVIGGTLGEKVKNGIFDKDIIGYMDWTIVESNLMVQQLTDCGVKNVFQLPNFKPITYYPNIKERINEWKKEITRPLRFVFLSRIMKEKGCDDIIEAARRLNATGFKDKYTIDFYGKIAETYKTDFFQKLAPLQNVNYRGFLNLQNEKGYDKLSQYDLMLFPTYWKGEGFAGVFIDVFISGVPMIVTDWAHNKQFMSDGETALFIPVHNVPALYDKMKKCIEGCYDIGKMALKCQQNAETYDVNKVITKELLKKLNLV
ncbi:glycosyltransferase [Paraprevotella clara]|uniref:glycosyltransferase n=1 Tax=Paraprevotella clara TaxID=454154 RepID=UPI0026766F2F|nr:glycosyltransferase [Paraprevotella clara]